MRRMLDVAKGQSMAEFALLAPVLILIMLGIFDAGRAVFAYNTVSNAARQGVRLAIVNQDESAIRTRAEEAMISLDLAATDVSIDIPCRATQVRIGCLATVQVAYDWQAITPLIGGLLGQRTIRAETTMPIERIFPTPTP